MLLSKSQQVIPRTINQSKRQTERTKDQPRTFFLLLLPLLSPLLSSLYVIRNWKVMAFESLLVWCFRTTALTLVISRHLQKERMFILCPFFSPLSYLVRKQSVSCQYKAHLYWKTDGSDVLDPSRRRKSAIELRAKPWFPFGFRYRTFLISEKKKKMLFIGFRSKNTRPWNFWLGVQSLVYLIVGVSEWINYRLIWLMYSDNSGCCSIKVINWIFGYG